MVSHYHDTLSLSIYVTKWQKLHNGKIPTFSEKSFFSDLQLVSYRWSICIPAMFYFHWGGILHDKTLLKWSDAWVSRKQKNQGSLISAVSLKKGLNDKNLFFSSILLLAANTELALWQCCSVLCSETSDWKRVNLDEIWGRSSSLWGLWDTEQVALRGCGCLEVF